MITKDQVFNMRQGSNDEGVFNYLYEQDASFKTAAESVLTKNPDMTNFEKVKFPSTMLDIYYGSKRKNALLPSGKPDPLTTQMVSASYEKAPIENTFIDRFIRGDSPNTSAVIPSFISGGASEIDLLQPDTAEELSARHERGEDTMLSFAGNLSGNIAKSVARLGIDVTTGLGKLFLGTLSQAADLVVPGEIPDVIGERAAVSNLLKLGEGTLKNAVETASAPVAKAINAAMDTELDPENIFDDPETESIATAMGQHFDDRLGVTDTFRAIGNFLTGDIERAKIDGLSAIQKLSKTGYEDPAGLLSDVMTLINLGATGMKIGAKTVGLNKLASMSDDVAMGAARLDPGARIAAKEIGIVGKTITKGLRLKTAEQLAEESKKIVGQITQGTPDDINRAMNTFRSLEDIGDTRTYKGFNDVLDQKIKVLSGAQDKLLGADDTVRKISEFTKKAGEGASEVSKNFIDESFKHLDELYDSTGAVDDLARIRALRASATENGLTLKQINDLAKEYGTEIGKKGFNRRTGEPLTSVNAQLYENTRKGLKEAVRGVLLDDASKLLDSEMSDLIDLRRMTDVVEGKVTQLQNKVIGRPILERAAIKTVKTIDLLSGHILRGIVESLFPSNVGLKQLNFIQIQERLGKNIRRLDKLLKRLDALPDEEAAKLVQRELGLIDDVDDVSLGKISPNDPGIEDASVATKLTKSGLSVSEADDVIRTIKAAKVGDTIEVPISTDVIGAPKDIPVKSWTIENIGRKSAPRMNEATAGPIEAIIENGELRLFDGVHRLGDAIRKGDKTVRVRIVD